MILKTANIFMTGGAGTLGKAIAQRRKDEGWTGRLTVYSTDAGKHGLMRRMFPDVTYIQGDIRNQEVLTLAMAGHDVVIHAAAVKFIPDSEYASVDTIDVNVYGSESVCWAARAVNARHVLGISTDKACHPANAYGASKMLMEKVFQEHARYGGETIFNLVRYGNVLESRGSVIEAWKKAVGSGNPVKITDPNMTRFWLSPSQAVDYVIESLKLPSGRIYVPKMPGLSIGKMLKYALGGSVVTVSDVRDQVTLNGIPVETIPLRPGEKLHEMLLTDEELEYAEFYPKIDGNPPFYVVHPSTDPRMEVKEGVEVYTSDIAQELTYDDLLELLRG